MGLDATPLLAEVWAALHALETAAAAKLETMTLLIDNLYVAKSLETVCENRGYRGNRKEKRMPSICAIAWERMAEILQTLHVTVVWVPSHGKKPEWTAPPGLLTHLCREANFWADAKCTDYIEEHNTSKKRAAANLIDAQKWCSLAISMSVYMHDALLENYPMDPPGV